MVRAYKFPPQPTRFVGRSSELADIHRLLLDPACRLLSLVGAGGMGKTRLASEAAAALLEQFSEGVYFVALQALTTPDLIAPTLLELLDCQFAPGGDPREKLLNALQHKSVLLVLDNFEHLMDATPLLADILHEAPMVKLLVTSRERLNIREEWVLEVGGLSLPNGDSSRAVEDYSAIQLFVQNARRINPGFSLAEQVDAVVRICQLVEGMPLALELASSWSRALSSAEIVEEIEHGLDILETSARDVPARHRNMRVVLDHSWERLEPAEQDVVKKLSVFRGGFTRDAAGAVAGASLPMLAQLVDKSWLRHDAAGGRYDVHEVLWQFGREKLEQSGLADVMLDAHLRYFAEFMQTRESGIKYRRQAESLAEIERDFENVRSAWKRAVAFADIAAINQMLEAMNFFSDMYARYDEGVELLTYAAKSFAAREDREGQLTYIRLRARRTRLILLGNGLPNDGLVQLVEEMRSFVALTRELESPRDLAFTLHQLSMAEAVTTQYHLKREALLESLDIYTQLNDRFYMAEELTWIGTTVMEHHLTGQDIRTSEEYFRQSLAILRDIGDQNGLGWVLMHMGYTASWKRNYDEAQRLYEEAIAIQRQRHDLKGLHSSLVMSSQRYLRLGNFEAALRVAQESAEIGATLSIPAIRQSSMVVLGLLFILLETDVDRGRQLCEEALNMNISHSFAVGDPHFDARQGLFVAAYLKGDDADMRRQYRAVLDLFPVYNVCVPEDKFALLAPSGVLMLAWESQSERAAELLSFILNAPDEPKSRMLHWLERLPLMERLRDELGRILGTETFEAAWERGKSLDLTCVVDDLETMLDEPVQPEMTSPTVSAQPDALTERELEVLGLVAEGLSNREIASRLVLALGTVKWYISEIYSKLGVTSRTQAIARARDLQLLT